MTMDRSNLNDAVFFDCDKRCEGFKAAETKIYCDNGQIVIRARKMAPFGATQELLFCFGEKVNDC